MVRFRHQPEDFLAFVYLYTSFAGEEGEETEVESPKIYEAISGFKELSDRLEMHQQQYNESIRGAKMDLVFFKVIDFSRVLDNLCTHCVLHILNCLLFLQFQCATLCCFYYLLFFLKLFSCIILEILIS